VTKQRKAKENVTIRDVARMAGVSPATVSRAFNAPDMLAKETLTRVREAMARSSFVPNILAGSLATHRSHSIALFVPSVALTLFEPTIRTIIEQFSEHNQQVLIGFGGRTNDTFNAALTQVLARRPDAVIAIGIEITPETGARIRELRIPFLQAWSVQHDPIDMSVGYSYHQVATALAQLVLRKGYRRPALVWGTGGISALTRHSLIRKLYAAGLHNLPFVATEFPGDFRDGVASFRELADDPAGPPDCILCVSDYVAHGVMGEAQRVGLVVPRDLAVIGFGDVPFAAGLAPALTTVRIDAERIGQLAADMTMRRLAGEPVDEPKIDLGFTLIERNSS